MAIRYIIGIDEVGRGPLAGPVAVGIVVMEIEKYEKLLVAELFQPGKDSKKLTPKRRQEAFLKIKELKITGDLNFGVFFEPNTIIDQYRISGAIKMAIKKGLKNLNDEPEGSRVLLDGSLKAPIEYINQESIVRGDESELIISLASIAAKVSRDEKMVDMAAAFPNYDWANNKGYGTKKHIEALKKCGPCELHRRSFIKNFI